MSRTVLGLIATLLSTTPLLAADFGGAAPPTPLAPVEGGVAAPACRAGVVSGLAVGAWIELLAVRAGPGVPYPLLDRLGNGYPVQVCAREGEWFAIVEADCPVNVVTWEGSPCAKGWSYRKWIAPVPPLAAPALAAIPPG